MTRFPTESGLAREDTSEAPDADRRGDADDAGRDASGSAGDSRPSEASELLFDDWLARQEEGDDEPFDRFVSRHPAHEAELRALLEEWSHLDLALDSALPETLIEESFFHGTRADGEELPQAVFDPQPGAVLGDYRLVRRIGQGGMGQVWEAEQVSLQRQVALKLIRPDRRSDQVVRNLAGEARAGGRANHPGLVAVYAAGEIEVPATPPEGSGALHHELPPITVPFIAQELVDDGFSLADFIARMRDDPGAGPVDYRKIAALFGEVADAVHAAHLAGILHRDLKPQNILIDREDRPKVTDFGLAHVRGEAGRGARPGLVGTYAYMSPEQAGDRDVEIDARSDVFALGAVLYEALTFRRAFEGDSGEQILDRILNHDPPDPRTIRSRVPGELATICGKALARNRANRYASMAELRDELRRFLRNEPILAHPPSPVTRAVKWSLRHPAWSTGLFLGSVALVFITLLLLREVDLRGLADRRADEAEARTYLANVASAPVLLAEGDHARARRILADCAPERRGWEWHHYALRADTSLLRLEGHAGPVHAVAVTADGRRYVTGGEDGTIRLWDQDGELLHTLLGHGGPVLSVAVTADGRTIVSGSADGTARVWDGRTGRDIHKLQGHESRVTSVAISANGNRIATGSDDGTARVWEGSGRIFAVLPGFDVAARNIALSADGRRIVTCSRYGVVRIWDAETGEQLTVDPLSSFDRHDVRVAIGPDGTRIYAGAKDGSVRLYDTTPIEAALDSEEDPVFRGYELIRMDLLGPPADVAAVAATADGSRVVTATDQGDTVLVWDGTPPPRPVVAPRPAAPAPSPEAADDTGDAAGEATTQPPDEPEPDPPIPQGRLVTELLGLDGRVLSVAVSADGSRIVAGSTEGVVCVWDGTTGAASVALGPLEPPASSLAADADGTVIATASVLDETIAVWDGATGRHLRDLPGHQGGVTAIALDHAGSRLVSGSYDGTLRVWSPQSGRTTAVLRGHLIGVSSVAVDGPGTLAASGSLDGTVRLWDLLAAAEQRRFDLGRGAVTSIALDARGRRVAAGTQDGAVLLIDTESGAVTALTDGTPGADGAVALSADGRRVAWAALREDLVRQWDADTGVERAVSRGYRPGVAAVALNADGSRLVSAATLDDDLRLFETDGAEMLALLTGHERAVSAVVFTFDGTRLISTSSDGTLRIWESDDTAARRLWRGLAARAREDGAGEGG